MTTATINVDASNGLHSTGIGLIVSDEQRNIIGCNSCVKPVRTHSSLAESYGIEFALHQAIDLLKTFEKVVVLNDNMGVVHIWNKTFRSSSNHVWVKHLVNVDILSKAKSLFNEGKLLIQHCRRESSVAHKLADRLARFAINSPVKSSVVDSYKMIIQKAFKKKQKHVYSKAMNKLTEWVNEWDKAIVVNQHLNVRKATAAPQYNTVYQPGFMEAMQLEQHMAAYFN